MVQIFKFHTIRPRLLLLLPYTTLPIFMLEMRGIRGHQINLITFPINKVLFHLETTILLFSTITTRFGLSSIFDFKTRFSDTERDAGWFLNRVTVIENNLFIISESLFAIKTEAEFAQSQFGRQDGLLCFFGM